jgi:phosphoribosylglycinamide formyltransferase-1
MVNIVIFASGSGSNAENIVHHFAKHPRARVKAIFCNNPNAGVIARAQKLNIPLQLFNKTDWQNETIMLAKLQTYEPTLIVLAGFLWLVPNYLINTHKHIINIHPALLPKFGGKGMYGKHVHKAVIGAGEKIHGITVHYVNEKYDDGEQILQASFEISETDTLETITSKISALELHYFPLAIEKVILQIENI